jgi:CBS-domain-containing membrane protein
VDDSETLRRILDLTVDTNRAVHDASRQLAAHEVRIGHVEDGVRELKGDQREGVRDLKGDRTHDRRQRRATRSTLRTSLLVGVCTVLLSTGGSAVVQIITR